MAHKKAAPEPAGESAPMWIVSYADLVTLTMSFFVVLYALKQGGPQQQAETAAAIADRFGAQVIPDSTDPIQIELMRIKGMPIPMKNLAGKCDQAANSPEGRNPEVQNIRQGDAVVSGGTINFEPGSVEIDPPSMVTVRKIYDILKGHNNILIVKGHIAADEVTMHPEDINGMGLSYRRAVVVADALAKLGIDRRVLRPTACGPFEPLKTQVYDTAAQRQNRRVEVFTTDTFVSEYVPTQTVPPPEAQSTTNLAPSTQHK